MKRLMDVILSLIIIVLLIPFFIIISILVWIKLGHPIIFTQTRPGKNEVPFKMLKFRSMLNLKDSQGNLLPNNLRRTKFGDFLRNTSLDEIPEFYNVLVGEMSLVGPRPLLMDYLPLYNEYQKQRHSVKPGITGWAQINGRNQLTWEKKFEYDVWYVHNQTILLDIKILTLTVVNVVKRRGIMHEKEVFMPRFNGTNITT